MTCPSCSHVNNVKIPETMWLSWIECEKCKNKILGGENHHGWSWVFCSHGDVPWVHIQEQEGREKI